MKHKISIMESLKEDLNLVINSPAELKHFSASTEDGGKRVLRQIFSFFSTLGQRSYVVSTWNGTWMRNAYSRNKCCCYALCSGLYHKTCFDVLKS